MLRNYCGVAELFAGLKFGQDFRTLDKRLAVFKGLDEQILRALMVEIGDFREMTNAIKDKFVLWHRPSRKRREGRRTSPPGTG